MRDLETIEEKITRAEIGATELSDNFGGLMFGTFGEALQFANVMASSKGGVPKHLRGDTGACLRIVLQAAEWRMSPYGVADKSYFVNDKIAFESQLIHAVVESRAPLQKRLRCDYEGEGPERLCICTGMLKGEVDPLIYKTPKIKDIKVKNSPLWAQDPDQQLWYYATRSWARRYVPDVLLGIYSREELEAEGDQIGPDKAKDITPKPSIASRLSGKKGRGFDHAHVEEQTSATRPRVAEETEAGGTKSVSNNADAPNNGTADGSPASEPIEVPDAMEMGRQAKRDGKPFEIPAALIGDEFAPQREAFAEGYRE
jgi:hypothetical protein